jgi:cellulose biosynthesis protein BcsQ
MNEQFSSNNKIKVPAGANKNNHKDDGKFKESLNIILADTDWQTFEVLSDLQTKYNVLNLSSEFAVFFILEHEKVDILITSEKIANVENVKKLCVKKKIPVFVLGKDLKYPPVYEEISKIIEKENILRNFTKKDKQKVLKERFFSMFKTGGQVKKTNEKNKLCELKGRTAPLTVKQDAGSDKNKNFIAIKQKIITFIKAKGGVGSTVLSLYLAHSFSKMRTLLIDMNFSEGGSDTGYYMELPRTPNILYFMEGYNRISLDDSIINIVDSMDVLQPPPTYEMAKKIDLQDLYNLIDVARKKYHLIIFDLPNLINDICLGILDMTDLAVLVSDNSPGSIGRLSDINERYIYGDMEKIIVLNKKRSKNENGAFKSCFGSKSIRDDLVCLEENKFLTGRSEFKKFDFHSLADFGHFEKRVLSKLTLE